MLNEIDQAFTSAFVSGDFGLPIVHENIAYTPIEGTAYAEIKMVPNDVTPLSLADTNETDGIFRVWLRYPPDKGAVAAKAMADTILGAFPIGGSVTYSGQKATITRHSRQAAVITDQNWLEVIVSIGYWAALER